MPKRKYKKCDPLGESPGVNKHDNTTGPAIVTDNTTGPAIVTDIRGVIDKYADESVKEILHKYCRNQSETKGQAGHNLVKQLITMGYDLNVLDALGNTPLHQAVMAKDTRGIQFLIHSGCDVNMVDSQGQTALIRAVSDIPCSFETVDTILTSQNIDVNLEDRSGWHALCYAVYRDNIAVCKLLLSTGANPNSRSMSPLFVAIKFDLSLAVIKLLVENGVYIDRKHSDYLLIEAILRRRIDVIKLLFQAGISCQPIWFRNAPFLLGLRRDELDIVKFYIEKGGIDTRCLNLNVCMSNIIHESTLSGSVKVLRYLIEYTDIAIDLQDGNGRTPLYSAVSENRISCVKELLAAGANGLTKSKYTGRTPFTFAGHLASNAILRLLLRNMSSKTPAMTDVKELSRSLERLQLPTNEIDQKKKILTDWIEQHANQMFRLQDLCLMKTRSALGQRPTRKVRCLNLPRQLITEILYPYSHLDVT